MAPASPPPPTSRNQLAEARDRVRFGLRHVVDRSGRRLAEGGGVEPAEVVEGQHDAALRWDALAAVHAERCEQAHEAALLGRVMAQGKHPGIVPLLDTYLNGDPPCIKYEFVAGGDLSGLIGQWRHTPPHNRVTECTRMMHELADIVAFARRVREGVLERFGVALVPEPLLVGFFPHEIASLGCG